MRSINKESDLKPQIAWKSNKNSRWYWSSKTPLAHLVVTKLGNLFRRRSTHRKLEFHSMVSSIDRRQANRCRQMPLKTGGRIPGGATQHGVMTTIGSCIRTRTRSIEKWFFSFLHLSEQRSFAQGFRAQTSESIMPTLIWRNARPGLARLAIAWGSRRHYSSKSMRDVLLENQRNTQENRNVTAAGQAEGLRVLPRTLRCPASSSWQRQRQRQRQTKKDR